MERTEESASVAEPRRYDGTAEESGRVSVSNSLIEDLGYPLEYLVLASEHDAPAASDSAMLH